MKSTKTGRVPRLPPRCGWTPVSPTLQFKDKGGSAQHTLAKMHEITQNYRQRLGKTLKPHSILRSQSEAQQSRKTWPRCFFYPWTWARGPEGLRMMRLIPVFYRRETVVQRGLELGWTLSLGCRWQTMCHPKNTHVSQHQEELTSKGRVSCPTAPNAIL